MAGWVRHDEPLCQHVYALDFDGVICDSADETMYSAFRATKRLWPQIFPPDLNPDSLLAKFRRLRPVIETGFENVLLMRMIVEDLDEVVIHDNFRALAKEMMSATNVDRATLVDLFGGERDRWIEEDAQSWVQTNRFFPGTSEALNFASSPVFIITTKQYRFADLLLKKYGVNLPEGHLFAVKTGEDKAEVLRELLSRQDLKDRNFHFVEDRLETLRAIMANSGCDRVHLYLATWGYNTEAERQEANALHRQRITQLPLDLFVKMQ